MKFQKTIIRLIFLIILPAIFTVASPAQDKSAAKPVEKPLPNLILITVDGQKWDLYENRGNVVLLNFWATWCVPCRTEIPVLVRLADKYEKNGLKVAGVSVDSENTAQINKFITNFKIKYPILLSVPGSLLSRQKAIPMSLLIDQNGFLAKKYIGAINEKIFEKDINDLLDKKIAVKKAFRNETKNKTYRQGIKK